MNLTITKLYPMLKCAVNYCYEMKKFQCDSNYHIRSSWCFFTGAKTEAASYSFCSSKWCIEGLYVQGFAGNLVQL